MDEGKKMNLYRRIFDIPDGSKLNFRVTLKDDARNNVLVNSGLNDKAQQVANWPHEDVTDSDGAGHRLEKNGEFYTLTLDLSFSEKATAGVDVSVTAPDGNELEGNFSIEVTGQKEKTHSVYVFMFMSRD